MWPRIIAAALAALSVFLKGLLRAAAVMFHEVTGAFFVLFAVIGAAGAWREWNREAAPWVIALSAAFALMMAAFAFSSFRKAYGRARGK
ncbi:MAG: hypothetical protein HY046_05420 [Acidobacteria bacterium]|nr:hypothetical protein [Acidobacteriota bacterium]